MPISACSASNSFACYLRTVWSIIKKLLITFRQHGLTMIRVKFGEGLMNCLHVHMKHEKKNFVSSPYD